MLPVVELFTSIQGEGKYIGIPSHFVRVSGCNLRCVFKDSICDTSYTSFSPDKTPYRSDMEFYDEFFEECHKYPKVKHLVITGGEPLLYRDDLEKFLKYIKKEGLNLTVTIETNGTQKPLSRELVDLYSISPKLSTSVGTPGIYHGVEVTDSMIKRHDKSRINIENLTSIITGSNDYQLKFVYSNRDCIDEIKDIESQLIKYSEKIDEVSRGIVLNINNHIMLMPEGINNNQLGVHREEIVRECIKNGWIMTDREHIIIWGDRRKV